MISPRGVFNTSISAAVCPRRPRPQSWSRRRVIMTLENGARRRILAGAQTDASPARARCMLCLNNGCLLLMFFHWLIPVESILKCVCFFFDNKPPTHDRKNYESRSRPAAVSGGRATDCEIFLAFVLLLARSEQFTIPWCNFLSLGE